MTNTVHSKIGLFAWLGVIFIINIGILFVSAMADTGVSNKLTQDVGEVLRNDFDTYIIDGDGTFAGLEHIVGNSSMDGAPDSLNLEDADATIQNEEQDESLSGFLEGVMALNHWAGKLRTVLGFIILGLGLSQIYLIAWSTSFPIWGYMIVFPITIQTIRLIAKIFFPGRVD